jgi:hypothetical protein
MSEKIKQTNEFSQNKISHQLSMSIGEGVCHGFVLIWIVAMKNKLEHEFWEWVDKVNNEGLDVPLLGSLYKAINIQGTYEKLFSQQTEHLKLDYYTQDFLKVEKLSFDQQDSMDIKEGFFDKRNEIASKVINSDNRYFMLGIYGLQKGHSIGIKREYAYIGKSKKVYIFDPNIGRYEVSGIDGVEKCLNELYKKHNNNLNSSCELISLAKSS